MSLGLLTSAPVFDTLVRAGSHHHLFHPAILHRLKSYLDRPYIPLLAVLESLAGAACYAASSVLQHQAAAVQPPEVSLRPSLLLRLLRSRRWILANGVNIAGYVFQFLALRRASLALVEPLFVVSLVFAIAGSALVNHRHPNARELASSLFVVIGLVFFLAIARPGPGHPRAASAGWLLLFAVSAAIVAGLMLVADREPRWRPLALGVGAGVVFGVTASITERTGHLLNGGVLHALASWSPYALVAVSVFGLFLNQSAYQAGDLRMSLPAIAVVEPLTAIIISQALFGEHIDHSALAVFGEMLGLLVMIAGVVRLSRTTGTALTTDNLVTLEHDPIR